MKGFSAHLPWVLGLAGAFLISIAGCGDAEPNCPASTECFLFFPIEGSCIESEVARGTPCDDGNGTCQSGRCEPSLLCVGVDCGDNNECTADICNPDDGECQNTPVADGTDCSGGLGSCLAGECVTPGLDGCDSVSYTFADGDFVPDTWEYTQVDGRSQGIRNIDSVTTVSPGGNDGAYHRVEVTVEATMDEASGIWVAHSPLDGAFYDPSAQGEICGIRVFLDGTDEFDQPQRSSFFSVFLFQNQTYYRGEPTLEVKSGMWETGTWTTDDFVRFDGAGPLNPVLSGSIQFGYLTGSSRPTTAPGSATTIAGADNFKVEIFPPEL